MLRSIKLNRKELEDKIYACGLGKNIGGTMGGPFEGCEKMIDIQGFTSEKGEPLPNDDLDLQLVWLRAMQHVGAAAMNANVLAEYWMTFIAPHWNEYGIGKANIRNGLLAPMCGEVNNDVWKHSNGAWIRSEIWACLAPGFPNIALKYAIMDASIDHGHGEGTYAEMFTASLESMAFVEKDIRKLIDMALAYIPEDWKEYIGDRIMQICINGSYRYANPGTCTKLTEWVMQTIPSVLFAHEIYMEYKDGETDCDKEWALSFLSYYEEHPTQAFDYSPYSYSTSNYVSGEVVVDFEKEPKVKPGEQLTFKYTIRNVLQESYNADVKLFLPDGWTADYDRTIYIDKHTRHSNRLITYTVTVTAGENVSSKNKLILSISSPARAIEYAIPVNILG